MKLFSKIAYGLMASTILSSSIIYAQGQSSTDIVDQISEGGVRGDSTNTDISPESRIKKGSRYEEALYEHVKFHSATNNLISEATDGNEFKNFAFDVKGYQEEQKEKELKNRIALLKAQKEVEQNEKERIRHGQGYCFMDKEVVVERLATYAYLNCNLNHPIGNVKLAVSMVPEYYSKALVGNPLYIVKGDTRIPISNGVVMTKDKNSLNLANLVNDRKIKKIAATGTYKSMGIIAEQAQAYIEDDIQARTTQEMVVTGAINGTTVSTATNRTPPEASDYWTLAGIQIVSELSRIIGESFVNDLPFTFKAYKGSVYYVDLQFSMDNNMEGYKMEQPNIFKKEPSFIDGLKKQNISETLPILNNHIIENKTTKTRPESSNIKSETVSEKDSAKGETGNTTLEELEAELAQLESETVKK